ncbi:MAG: branched-chain amino acid ABC transporter permease [Bacillota bacterium]|nr:branched-chain amino acid ABC transporter permease [Bacillota bacterium]
MFFQQLITGLSIGSVYALMAVGYSLIYSLLNFTNFAHSVAIMVGAYAAYYYLRLATDNIILATLCSILVGSLISVFIEKTTYQPLLNKKSKRIYLLIAGLGVSIIGENLIVVMIDGRFKAFPTQFSSQPITFLGINLGLVDIVILISSIITLIAVQLIIQKTKVGLAIRGAAFDLTATSLMGVNVNALILIVFVIAGTLAGLSGSFLGLKYTAYPSIGSLTTKAFISAVFGGLGSVPGAMCGALILGIGETMISAYVSSSLRDIFSFGLLVVVLLIRPSGLMGKVTEEKA